MAAPLPTPEQAHSVYLAWGPIPFEPYLLDTLGVPRWQLARRFDSAALLLPALVGYLVKTGRDAWLRRRGGVVCGGSTDDAPKGAPAGPMAAPHQAVPHQGAAALAGMSDGAADGVAVAAAADEVGPAAAPEAAPPHQQRSLFAQPLNSARLGPFMTRTFDNVILGGLELGILNFLGTALQVEGLHSTSATRAGFLAEVTAVLTPLVSYLAGYDIPRQMWLAVAVGLVGSTLVAYDTSQAHDAQGPPSAKAASSAAAAATSTSTSTSTSTTAANARVVPPDPASSPPGTPETSPSAGVDVSAGTVPLLSAPSDWELRPESASFSVRPEGTGDHLPTGAVGVLQDAGVAAPGASLLLAEDLAPLALASASDAAMTPSVSNLNAVVAVSSPLDALDAASIAGGAGPPPLVAAAAAVVEAAEVNTPSVSIAGSFEAVDAAAAAASDTMRTLSAATADVAASATAAVVDAAADAASLFPDTSDAVGTSLRAVASTALQAVGAGAADAAGAAAAASSVEAAEAVSAVPLAITGGEAYLLLACLFYSICTVRMGIYAPRMDTVGLAAMKKVGLSSMSVMWMAATNLQNGVAPGAVLSFPDLSSRTPMSIAVLMYSGLGPGALATFLQVTGLSTVPATTAQVIYSMTPLCTAFFAYLILGGEATGPVAWAGGSLIIGAALMAADAQQKQHREQQQQLQQQQHNSSL
ncbi:hypothetical protein VOLCADRAFT_87524 [Volvox carteri f. nagariensis]|uniref:EamA domain-containing protein n=1 Tax=Volvox carteri f. nagariensis TaxID=3068 RepID=D8TLJ1_VOLCA|nr:uncharacterized protein VOLCADRAFT_87524 [Volvox carteri f. nagariensis]EFJ51743.1 hypothetical protein VOLCADRAFT_87524 [Volvox carteri f. nagariensis]|eukprot:XP_002947153.1 hypothetical protein VOLCADRAFT_87524 [Volvox carteri f. nagariensis]